MKSIFTISLKAYLRINYNLFSYIKQTAMVRIRNCFLKNVSIQEQSLRKSITIYFSEYTSSTNKYVNIEAFSLINNAYLGIVEEDSRGGESTYVSALIDSIMEYEIVQYGYKINDKVLNINATIDEMLSDKYDFGKSIMKFEYQINDVYKASDKYILEYYLIDT